MSVFYSIHAYDQESRYRAAEDRIDNGILYTTFEQACDAIEKKIQAHIDDVKMLEVYVQPNREEKKKEIDDKSYVHYYESVLLRLFVIRNWKVAE